MSENKKSGLNLTIKEGRTIWIGDAEVRINAARKGYVRLSVIAPKSVIVNRLDPVTLAALGSSEAERSATHESPGQVAGSIPAPTPQEERVGALTDERLSPTKITQG